MAFIDNSTEMIGSSHYEGAFFSINKIRMNNEVVNAISARELHSRLASKQDFSTWIKKRLESCNAKENIDFIILKQNNTQGLFHNSMENPQPKDNGRPKVEYILTLDIAKHIAMLEKNEIGMYVRQYFIDYEVRVSESQSHIQGLINIAKSQIKALEATQESVKIIADRVRVLESTKRLESWQERSLSDSVKSKVAELTKGRDIGTNIKSAYFRAIYKRLKGKFYVARYSEIPSIKYEEALEYVRNITQDDLVY